MIQLGPEISGFVWQAEKLKFSDFAENVRINVFRRLVNEFRVENPEERFLREIFMQTLKWFHAK